MKKSFFVLFMAISIFLSGCSAEQTIEKKYTYSGESDNWAGEYEMIYLVDFPIEDGKVYAYQKKNHTLTVSYKGELSDLSNVKHLEISYKRGSGSGGSHIEDYDSPPQRKEFRFSGSSGSKAEIGEYPAASEKMQNAYRMYEAYREGIEKIEVVIDIDGKTENLELLISEESKLIL